MNSPLLKVTTADLTSPFQEFQFKIGKKYVCDDFDPDPENVCSNGFYATEIEGITYAYRPGRRVFEVDVSGRNVDADPIYKRRWEEMTLIREVFRPELEALAKAREPACGYMLAEAIFPINPLLLPKRSPTAAEVKLIHQWMYRRKSVEGSVWYSTRDCVWKSVGGSVRESVGESTRDCVWKSVCESVWPSVRGSVRDNVELSVCAGIGYSVKESVSAYIGSLFPNIDKWYYAKHQPGEYPFQPAVDLWRRGLIPSFDGEIWRLHSGEKAEIVWEEK